MASGIRLCDLSRGWGRFRLQRISLEVKAGEYFVLLGPIGSGKTLLLETIAGLHAPAAGQVFLGDTDITGWLPERRQFGLVYQRSMLFPHLTVQENIRFGLRFSRLARDERDAEVGKLVGLLGLGHLADRMPAGLSGGEMQKVALARALAIRPKALLLDEPLSPLDSLSREELQGQLMALHRQLGTTTVEVTHDQTHARGMADRVGVIRDGELLQVGVVEEVFERPASRFVAEFLGVGNIFSGHARREGAETRVRVGGGMDAVVPGAWAGPVDLCIRPERVRVFRQRPEGMPNVAPARVVEVSMQTPLVRLSLAAGGLEFRALVSMTELRSLGCTAGSDVWFSWPPEDIHVLGPGKP